MKEYDKVKLIINKPEYIEQNIHKGDVGYICLPEIRDNCFYVEFETGNSEDWYKYANIKIEDLELVKDGGFTDEEILDGIPNKDPHWWFKVEDGYIMNLLGEKKNKIPYDYNS